MHKEGILALGGGTIENSAAMKIAKEADIMVFLDTDEKTLYKRIRKNGFPSFLEKSPEKLFHELYLRRRILYKNIATITIKITDEKPEEILSTLIKGVGVNL